MDLISRELERYPNAASSVFVQEEPLNEGPWAHVHPRIQALLDQKNNFNQLECVGRPPLAATAEGYTELFTKFKTESCL
eukprot:TRINITY_DN1204_c0_g1_i1.p1 TRINITY_DN1204_c0_g1~~TRINITY_DN1204_c0_g1_i1.p1  ORF type:complete len:79 (+),score=10.04 TRINITY_DN1204_c0_g1_i1:386-622(+)